MPDSASVPAYETFRAETTVLRHHFTQRSHKNRADVIERIHDIDNCELCELIQVASRSERLQELWTWIQEAVGEFDAEVVYGPEGSVFLVPKSPVGGNG